MAKKSQLARDREALEAETRASEAEQAEEQQKNVSGMLANAKISADALEKLKNNMQE